MGTNVFGVDPEEGVPPDQSPANTPPEPKRGDEPQPPPPAPPSEPPAEPPAEPPPPAQPPPPKDEPKPEPVGPPIDDEERQYLAGEDEDGFVLGQRKYKSLAAADHVFRRFGGRAHAAEQRAKAAEERAQQLEERLTHTLLGRPQEGAPPGAPADEPAPTPSAPQRLTDLVKPEEFDELIAEHGPGAAYAKVAELVEQRMGQALDERMAPLQPLMNRSQGVELATQVFDSESERTSPDGQRIYPELDPETPESDAVVAIWTEMLADPDFSEIAFTRHGVRQAVLEYRARGGNSQPAPPEPPVHADRGAAIQDMGRGGRSPSPVPPGPTRRLLGGDLEEAARKAVVANQHPIFGTTVETRRP